MFWLSHMPSSLSEPESDILSLPLSPPPKGTSFRLPAASPSHRTPTPLLPHLHRRLSSAGAEARVRRGGRRKGSYCKIVNLCIPLPDSNGEELKKGGGGGGGVGIGGADMRVLSRRHLQEQIVPRLKMLQLVALGENSDLGQWKSIPLEHNYKIAQHTSSPSPLPISSFLGHLTTPSTPSPLSSSLTKHPHPSTEYPDLSLSSQRLCTPHSSPPHSHTFPEPLYHSPLHNQHQHTPTVLPPRMVPHPSLFHSLLRAKGQSLGKAFRMSRLSMTANRLSGSRKPDTYPDPLRHGPAPYHSRLAQLTLLVADTKRREGRGKAGRKHSHKSF